MINGHISPEQESTRKERDTDRQNVDAKFDTFSTLQASSY
jgi:hypothetical protein